MSLRLIYIGAASAIEATFKTGTLHGLFNGRYGNSCTMKSIVKKESSGTNHLKTRKSLRTAYIN